MQIAADDLHVIEIELHLDVRLARLGDDVGGVLDVVEEIIRPVARVDRLDQQRDVLGRGEIGGALEIVEKHAVGGRALLGRHLAGKAMDRAAADRRDVIERAGKQPGEILLAPGHRRQAELALALARRRVDAEHGELVARDRRFHRAAGTS